MLYKNGKLIELSEKEIESFKSEFTRFPISIVYVPELVKKDPDNELPTKPQSINIPCVQRVTTKKGSDEWRYAEQSMPEKSGILRHIPKSIGFEGRILITDANIEFGWYVFNCVARCRGGKNMTKGIMYYTFEDKGKQAADEVRAEMLLTKVKSAILLPVSEQGLGEPALRDLAKSYFLTGVDDKTLPEVQKQLLNRVGEKPLDMTEFLERSNRDTIIQLKSRIQTAIDEGVIRFAVKASTWYYFDRDGVQQDKIAKVPKSRHAAEALFEFLSSDGGAAEEFVHVLKDRLTTDSV